MNAESFRAASLIRYISYIVQIAIFNAIAYHFPRHIIELDRISNELFYGDLRHHMIIPITSIPDDHCVNSRYWYKRLRVFQREHHRVYDAREHQHRSHQ